MVAPRKQFGGKWRISERQLVAKKRTNMHDLRVAAMSGDYAACRTLLRLHSRHAYLAAEIIRGKPIPPRVKRMLAALTAGTNTDWEYTDERGLIQNLLQHDPLPRGKAVVRDAVFED
jgi:hypothetical protein